MIHTLRLTSGGEATTNAATIAAISRDVLPDGPAREALLALAEGGCDVYAYSPRNRARDWQTPTNITIWLAPTFASWEGRMTPAEWMRVYALATTSDQRDVDAVDALARRYAALWELSYTLTDGTPGQPGDLAAWRRPDGLTDCEQALSYWRWHMYLVGGPVGAARFCGLLAAASPIMPSATEPADGQEGSATC